MRQMPYEIKKKLRQYANAQEKASKLLGEIMELFDRYGVPEENLFACANPYGKEPQTEGIAFLNNGECDDVEGTIEEIEKVFLWFVNNAKKRKCLLIFICKIDSRNYQPYGW